LFSIAGGGRELDGSRPPSRFQSFDGWRTAKEASKREHPGAGDERTVIQAVVSQDETGCNRRNVQKCAEMLKAERSFPRN
jgi:hypothetical protein